MDNKGFGDTAGYSYGQGFNMTPPMPFHLLPYNGMVPPHNMAHFVQGTMAQPPAFPMNSNKPKTSGGRQPRWTDIEVRTVLVVSWYDLRG